MKKNSFKTTEVTRKIRDSHYEELKKKSTKQQIEFYRNKASQLQPEKTRSQ